MVTFASPLQPTRPAPTSPATSAPNYTPFSLKRKTMSITQTYFLAHKARAKLAREASRSDHDLRLLVGHANLLDGLMLELADAEREQESWFNSSVRGAARADDERVEYEDTIIEVPDEDDDWSESDSSDEESDEDDDDVEMADAVALRRLPVSRIQHLEEDDDEDDEELEGLGLVRTSSHSSPPELDDDEESSEDESMPPSPPTAVLTFSEKERDGLGAQAPFYETGFYVPPRNPARLVAPIAI